MELIAQRGLNVGILNDNCKSYLYRRDQKGVCWRRAGWREPRVRVCARSPVYPLSPGGSAEPRAPSPRPPSHLPAPPVSSAAATPAPSQNIRLTLTPTYKNSNSLHD